MNKGLFNSIRHISEKVPSLWKYNHEGQILSLLFHGLTIGLTSIGLGLGLGGRLKRIRPKSRISPAKMKA